MSNRLPQKLYSNRAAPLNQQFEHELFVGLGAQAFPPQLHHRGDDVNAGWREAAEHILAHWTAHISQNPEQPVDRNALVSYAKDHFRQQYDTIKTRVNVVCNVEPSTSVIKPEWNAKEVLGTLFDTMAKIAKDHKANLQYQRHQRTGTDSNFKLFP